MTKNKPVQTIQLNIKNQAQNILLLSRCVETLLDFTPLSNEQIQTVHLALVEAINNIVRHAYQNNDKHDGLIEVEVIFHAECVEFHLRDQGIATGNLFASDRNPSVFDSDDINAIPDGGWGIFIIKNHMDEIHYQRKEPYNHLHLYKKYNSKGNNP